MPTKRQEKNNGCDKPITIGEPTQPDPQPAQATQSNADRLNALIKEGKKHHAAAVAKGFYDDDFSIEDSRLTQDYAANRAMLIVGEIGEAYEAVRKGRINPPAHELTSIELVAMAWVQQRQLIGMVENQPHQEAYLEVYRMRAAMDMEHLAAAYNSHIKGTLAEELADIVIRCYDFIGGAYTACGQPVVESEDVEWFWENVECYAKKEKKTIDADFLHLVKIAQDIGDAFDEEEIDMEEDIVHAVSHSIMHAAAVIEKNRQLAEIYAVPLDLHIFLKSEYNKTRPYKHGKNF